MPGTFFELFVALLLALWSLASLLNQLDSRWMGRLRAHEYFGLLPRWRFFDRDSGQYDYHLFYRQRDAAGTVSSWREVPATESRRPWHCVWNPEKRSTKVLTDLASSLQGSEWRHQPAVMLTLPYLLLLNVVCNQDGSDPSVRRQFMIAWTSGRRSTYRSQILFRSSFHAPR